MWVHFLCCGFGSKSGVKSALLLPARVSNATIPYPKAMDRRSRHKVGQMKKSLAIMAAVCGLAVFSSSAIAQVRTVGRGDPERKQIMDAMRPAAVRELGAPVEFVVRTLNLSGNYAYAEVEAQRTGGTPINIAKTPFGRSNANSLDFIDCCHIESILQKRNGSWVVIERTAYATDYGMSEDWCRKMPRGFFGRACQ